MPLTASFAEHGGRLCVARALHPQAPQPWIDLSTGINPQSYPAPRASEAARARLPAIEEIRALESVAARVFEVGDAARAIATAGSEAVLRLMPYVLRTQSAIIVGPTYSSHAAAYRAADCQVGAIRRFENVVPSPATVTVVNPNNPDGIVISRERLLKLHDEIASRQGYLVVDEAFADVEPECSVAAAAGTSRYPHLVVLRSFGKFYGLAGIRLGFAIAAPRIIERLHELLGDWAISADAIAAAIPAYADDEWAANARQDLRRSAQRLDGVLTSSGLTVVGGTSLFRLTRSDDARVRFERLLRAGILVRPFDYDASLLRFGLPHAPSEWQRLADALRQP